MSEESIMKEMLYWRNKAGELALRVLELEKKLKISPNKSDAGKEIGITKTQHPNQQVQTGSDNIHKQNKELLDKDYAKDGTD